MGQGPEYGMVLYARVTQSSELVSICLNMPQYPLMSLNMPDKLINIEYP